MVYFEIEAFISGDREILFGSFDRDDCKYELEAEKESWKDQGYKKIKLVSRETKETPDPKVYCNGDNYQAAICEALKYKTVGVFVGDTNESFLDLENSRDISEIYKAVEATESPFVEFRKDDQFLGRMIVLVGGGDESIIDHSSTNFMAQIVTI